MEAERGEREDARARRRRGAHGASASSNARPPHAISAHSGGVAITRRASASTARNFAGRDQSDAKRYDWIVGARVHATRCATLAPTLSSPGVKYSEKR